MKAVTFELAEGFHTVLLNCNCLMERLDDCFTKLILLESHLLTFSTNYVIPSLKVSDTTEQSPCIVHNMMLVL